MHMSRTKWVTFKDLHLVYRTPGGGGLPAVEKLWKQAGSSRDVARRLALHLRKTGCDEREKELFDWATEQSVSPGRGRPPPTLGERRLYTAVVRNDGGGPFLRTPLYHIGDVNAGDAFWVEFTGKKIVIERAEKQPKKGRAK